MNIRKYIAEAEKTYRLRLKTIVPLDDVAMDKIERAVAKYHLIDISKPKKTILQKAPLDFRNVESAEVWIVDMVFGLPASAFAMREDIRKALDSFETSVVVRSHNDALEIETKRQNAIRDIADEAERRGLTPMSLLSTDPDYVEAEVVDPDTLSGTAYNAGLIAYLKQIEDAKRESRAKSDKALFNWMDLPKMPEPDVAPDENAFNLHIKDAPTLTPSKSKAKMFKNTEIFGDEDDNQHKISRVYKDEKGKRFVLSRTLGEE